MDLLKALLEQSPLMALFLAIAVGYALGEINIKGLSFGVGAVLFVGLAIGAFAPKSVPPALLGSLGLVMFLYGIGIQYGKQFFAGLTGPAGRKSQPDRGDQHPGCVRDCLSDRSRFSISGWTMSQAFFQAP